MIMRTNTLVTHLRPEDAYTVVEVLDQLRDLLMATYGGEITAMLQKAAPRLSTEIGDEPF
jgi:hypothetical protein